MRDESTLACSSLGGESNNLHYHYTVYFLITVTILNWQCNLWSLVLYIRLLALDTLGYSPQNIQFVYLHHCSGRVLQHTGEDRKRLDALKHTYCSHSLSDYLLFLNYNSTGSVSSIYCLPSYCGPSLSTELDLSLIHIWRCRRLLTCRSRWSPYH